MKVSIGVTLSLSRPDEEVQHHIYIKLSSNDIETVLDNVSVINDWDLSKLNTKQFKNLQRLCIVKGLSRMNGASGMNSSPTGLTSRGRGIKK